jgi:ribosomal protein S8
MEGRESDKITVELERREGSVKRWEASREGMRAYEQMSYVDGWGSITCCNIYTVQLERREGSVKRWREASREGMRAYEQMSYVDGWGSITCCNIYTVQLERED